MSSISCAGKFIFLCLFVCFFLSNNHSPFFVFSGRKPSSLSTELRLVLLGKAGSGKSSTANTILGRKVFDTKVGGSFVIRRCRRASGEFCGRNLMLLDTPGFLDSHQMPQEVERELRRSVSLLYPGPHVFLLVIQIGSFTQEDKERFQEIKLAMGSLALSFTVVVFTHGDLLDDVKSVNHCLIDGRAELAQLVQRCGGRYCVFNNQSSKSKEQVSELLALVESVLQGNGGNCFSSKMLQKAEEDLAQELQQEKRHLKEKEDLRRLNTSMKELYEKELEIAQQKCKREMEELKKKHKLEREMEEKMARDHEKLLQEKLDKVTKMLAEQAEQEEKMRRAMEEKIQKEQAIRKREEMKRDALQKELDTLIQSRSRKEEEVKEQMKDLLREERKKNQREKDIQMENQRAEKRRTVALQPERKLIQMKSEQQKTSSENLKKQLEENPWREKEQCDREVSMLKNQCNKKCPEPCCEKMRKMSPVGQSRVKTLTGYVQEMGLVGLNVALENVGASCSIQ